MRVTLPAEGRGDRPICVNGASASRVVRNLPWRRVAIELLLLVALGSLMAALGPYDTDERPPGLRALYWLMAIVGGGIIGIAVDLVLGPRIGRFWPRVPIVTVAMTPIVMALVYGLNAWLLDLPVQPRTFPRLAWQVFVIALLVMAMRALAWRKVVETRTLVVPPMPEAERTFRLRLSAKRRAARLIAPPCSSITALSPIVQTTCGSPPIGKAASKIAKLLP